MKLIKGILDLVMTVWILMGILLSVPRLWGFQIYAVTSGSMEPQIQVGDAIYVKTVPFMELCKGDVITFSRNDGKTTVTHRIERINQKYGMIQTKGDANEQSDSSWVTEETVLGKVYYKISGLGYVALLVSTLSGKLFVLAVFLWLAAAQIALSGIDAMYHRREMCVYQKNEV